VNKSSDTYDRVLASGVNIGSTVGMQGVTLGNLAAEAQLSKSGLFAHFGSKDELQIALFGRAQALARRTVVEPVFREPEGLARLLALINNWFGWTGRAGLPGGCPFAAAAFEFDDLDGPVRDHVVSAHNDWVALLESFTRNAVATGEFRRNLDVEQFVWELHGIYLSHHVSQRLIQDASADKRRRSAVDRLLREAGAPAATATRRRPKQDKGNP
jgi:AcrR family transcriptional regulator